MDQAGENPKRRNNMMESARLKADIVSGLGADGEDEEKPKEKDHEAEPTRKYAMMKTKEEDGTKSKEA